MEPKEQENEQDTDSELLSLQETLDLHTDIIHDMLPFMPQDVQARIQTRLGEQQKVEHDHALHSKVDTVHADLQETKTVLSSVQKAVDDLTRVVTDAINTAPAPAPANPPENKDRKEESKDDKKEEPGKNNSAPPESPEITIGDAPVYLYVRKRGGRIVKRLMKSKPVQK